jgi:hypothetical protein
MKRSTIVILTVISTIGAGSCLAGGELPAGGTPVYREPSPSVAMPPAPGGNSIPGKAIGPILGACVPRNAPLPAPQRRVGDGFCLNEFYGPTYYYPARPNNYEGLNPTYYPFFHPRLWPNYKSPGTYDMTGGACGPNGQCGSSRSSWAWDSYDDWTRDGRYGDRQ